MARANQAGLVLQGDPRPGETNLNVLRRNCVSTASALFHVFGLAPDGGGIDSSIEILDRSNGAFYYAMRICVLQCTKGGCRELEGASDGIMIVGSNSEALVNCCQNAV